MTTTLETERLVLRPLAASDTEAHCAMMGEQAVAQFLTADGKAQSKPTAWRGYASMLGHWEIRGFGMFSVFEKDTGDWVGRVGPWMPEGWPGLECGWAIIAERWGRGYAAEAAVRSIQWTFDRFPDLDRIISVIDPNNANSQAVARKIGEANTGDIFLYEETVRLDIWATGRQEFLNRWD